MCFFPKKAYNNKYIDSYECGVCPECLRKRSGQWALRVYGEYKTNPVGMALCLTYDSYIRDSRGKIIGERVASDMTVNKRDIQLFIKRLRKYISDNVPKNPSIKYIATSEYGKKTHRPHYHVIIMGYRFDDCVFYKKSKRGNVIYQSAILRKLWPHGICTVDAVKLSPSIARYCTKYTMKDKGVDTFSLMSRDIGVDWLNLNFNWKSYIVEGREYPVPRLVMQRQCYDRLVQTYSSVYRPLTPICKKKFARADYACFPRLLVRRAFSARSFTYKYRRDDFVNRRSRALFSRLKRTIPEFAGYLSYWKKRAVAFPSSRLPVMQRLMALPPKYELYVKACRRYLNEKSPFKFPAPRASLGAEFFRSVERYYNLPRFCPSDTFKHFVHLAYSSRHNTPNDTNVFTGFEVYEDDEPNSFDDFEIFPPLVPFRINNFSF